MRHFDYYLGSTTQLSLAKDAPTPRVVQEPEAVPHVDMSDPQTLNLYGYVRNNPLSHADAGGHCCAPYELADYLASENRAHKPHPSAAKINLYRGFERVLLIGEVSDKSRSPSRALQPHPPDIVWSRHHPQRSYIATDLSRAQKPCSFVHWL